MSKTLQLNNWHSTHLHGQDREPAFFRLPAMFSPTVFCFTCVKVCPQADNPTMAGRVSWIDYNGCPGIRLSVSVLYPAALLTDCFSALSLCRAVGCSLTSERDTTLCAMGRMIHKVAYLCGARSVNSAQKRTDCVCHACITGWVEMLLF